MRILDVAQLRIIAHKWDTAILSQSKVIHNDFQSGTKKLLRLAYNNDEEEGEDDGSPRNNGGNQSISFIYSQMTLEEAKAFIKLPLKLIPNIIPTNGYEFRPDTQVEMNSLTQLRQMTDKQRIGKQRTQQILANEILLLPFTLHSEKVTLHTALKVKYESEFIHNIVFYRAVKLEADLKIEILRKCIHEQKREFYKQMTDYKCQLKEFVMNNLYAINLRRTEMMLKTNAEQLLKIQKKEAQLYTQRQNRIKFKKTNVHDREIFLKDHLPFGSVVTQIAMTLPEAPQRPKLRLNLSNKQFEDSFKSYHDLFLAGYSRLCIEERLKSLPSNKAR